MTGNHEEYSNDTTLNKLKCSVQNFFRFYVSLQEKLTKEIELTKLAFSNFLYNSFENSILH